MVTACTVVIIITINREIFVLKIFCVKIIIITLKFFFVGSYEKFLREIYIIITVHIIIYIIITIHNIYYNNCTYYNIYHNNNT